MDYELECMGLIVACESYMDALELELAMEAALEAEGETGSAGGATASGIGAKLRAAFGKLRKGDKKAAAEAAEAAEELAEASDEAETPEEKKKLSTAAKVGMAAAATVAAAAGMYALGKKFEKSAKQEGASDPKAMAKALIEFSKKSDSIAKNIRDKADDVVADNFTTKGRLDKANFKRNKISRETDGKLSGRSQDKYDKALKKESKLLFQHVADSGRRSRKRLALMNQYSKESYANDDSILNALAYGLEGFMCDEDVDDQIVMESLELIDACESYMDTLELELAMEAALEAEGEEGSEGGATASGIGAKLRSAFSKLRKGDKKGAEEAAEAAEELAEAADEAETPEEKKKLGTAAKVGMAAAAAVAAAAGMYALGKKFEKSAKQEGASDPKAMAKALIGFANRGDRIATAVRDVGYSNLTVSGRADKAALKHEQYRNKYSAENRPKDYSKKERKLFRKADSLAERDLDGKERRANRHAKKLEELKKSTKE